VFFVICTSEKKVNSLVFIAEMEDVYYPVRTGCLNKTDTVSSLKGTL
jgi:hypothetical protein